MTDKQFQKIIAQISDHEARINVLESMGVNRITTKNLGGEKQKTLREIVKGRKFDNGQEQIAVIVGYNENILGMFIHKDNIKTQWVDAKMTNKYNTTFIERAKDDLIRIKPDDTCDLTQTGEEFFDKFVKNEPTKTASK